MVAAPLNENDAQEKKASPQNPKEDEANPKPSTNTGLPPAGSQSAASEDPPAAPLSPPSDPPAASQSAQNDPPAAAAPSNESHCCNSQHWVSENAENKAMYYERR